MSSELDEARITMRAMPHVATVVLLCCALVLSACSEDSPSTDFDEEAVIEAVTAANDSFAAGDYDRTCSYYTAAAQREIADSVSEEECESAWSAIAAVLNREYSDQQLAALTAYVPGSVEIDGETATATYGDPPEDLPPELATSSGATITLERQDDRWLIASLPDT